MSGQPSYSRKAIDVTFTLAQSKFTNGTNSVKLSGHRVNATIENSGGIMMGVLDLHIFGLTASVINSLSVPLGTPLAINVGNTVLVEAGPEGGSMTVAFKGTINGAWIETQNAPNVYFHVTAAGGFDATMQTVPPTSQPGGQDVATIMGSLAKAAGLAFENNGVVVKLASPYLWGSPRQQIAQLAEAAGIDWTIDNQVLAIMPRGAARAGDAVLVSPATGLVGYPRKTANGVDFTRLYDGTVKFNGKVKIQGSSDILKPCDGVWRVSSMSHFLSAQQPNGPWFTWCNCWNLPGV